jgi:hypothetical protein
MGEGTIIVSAGNAFSVCKTLMVDLLRADRPIGAPYTNKRRCSGLAADVIYELTEGAVRQDMIARSGVVPVD